MNAYAYEVEVKVSGEWTHHSNHQSYRDAVDQADMVRGRVTGDEAAWKWARDNQGFHGDFAAWQSQDNDERSEYEAGAAGIPTS